jgi:hypothetical protein
VAELDAGINFVDTADVYGSGGGDGESERIVGITLLEHMFAFEISTRPISIDGPLARQLRAGLRVYDAEVNPNSATALF